MSLFTETTNWYRRWGDKYLVTSPLLWDIGRKGSGYTVTVPVSFGFDVSVPRALRWLADPHDPRYLKAAALHDYLLHREQWDRWTAGAAFYAGLRVEKVSVTRAALMTLATILWRLSE